MHADELFEQFVQAYPAARRQRGYIVTQLFLTAVDKVGFDRLMRALEQHVRSEQWHNGMIPLMKRWLEEERWIQVLPEAKTADQQRAWSRLTPMEQARQLGYKK